MSKGLRSNDGKTRWRNVPLFLFEDIIKVGQFGETKYDTFNYLKGLSINDTLDALKRHLTKFESPYESDIDIESLQNHLAHVAWNAIVALHMVKSRPDLDDRYKLPESKQEESIVYTIDIGEETEADREAREVIGNCGIIFANKTEYLKRVGRK